MTPLKTLLAEHSSKLSFARTYDIHPYQLRRWLDNDAHVDDEGNVYIQTKGKLTNKSK
jgi:hypothetical protein